MNNFVTFFAEDAIFVLLLALPWLWYSNQQKLARTAALSAGLAWLVSNFIKNFFYFHRPFPLRLMDGSFPSLHTAVAFAISFAIYRRLPKFGLALLFLSSSIGVSRVVSRIHYPIDILTGAVLGIAVAWALDTYHSK